MAKKKITAKQRAALQKYNRFQKVLSSYTKERGLKTGKDFSKYASRVYREAELSNKPLKYVRDNIDFVFREYSEYTPKKKDFKPFFPFYIAVDELLKPVYDGVNVIIYFDDGLADFSFEGSSDDFPDWYVDSGLEPHIRQHHNESPIPVFEIEDSDYRTYVKYNIRVGAGMADRESPKEKPSIYIAQEEKKEGGASDLLKRKRELIEELRKSVEAGLISKAEFRRQYKKIMED